MPRQACLNFTAYASERIVRGSRVHDMQRTGQGRSTWPVIGRNLLAARDLTANFAAFVFSCMNVDVQLSGSQVGRLGVR
jgi:hypothetical protein